MKPKQAWAVVNKNGQPMKYKRILNTQASYLFLTIFPTRKDAEEFVMRRKIKAEVKKVSIL